MDKPSPKRIKFSARRVLAAAGTLALCLQSAGCSSGEPFEVIPTAEKYHGLSYSDLGAKWWQWLLSIPNANSPAADTTGMRCQLDQKDPVFFLAGYATNTSLATATRSCTIPPNQAIFFPIINSYWGAGDGTSEAELRMLAKQQQDRAKNLSAEIDGVSVPNVSTYREVSTLFSVKFPADNVFGEPDGFVYSPSVDDGVYLLLKPLSPGVHEIHFHGEITGDKSPDFILDVTYHLNAK